MKLTKRAIFIFVVGATVLTASIALSNDSNNICTSINGINHQRLKTDDPCQILEILGKYENDPCWPVRKLAYLYEVELANLQPTKEIRHEVSKRLVNALIDPNSGLSGDASSWLLTFREGDFSVESKKRIKDALLTKERPGIGLIKIAGVAGTKETLPRLGELLIDEDVYRNNPNPNNQIRKWYYAVGWNARLARARMGIKGDIEKCIRLVDSEPHRGIGALTPLNDIGYIRQPEAIEFLKSYVFSDETIGQVELTVPGEPVASYVMGILTDCLENFPIKKKEQRGYTQEEIELFRKWMSEQKEWKIIR